jgi:hypothetical protein
MKNARAMETAGGEEFFVDEAVVEVVSLFEWHLVHGRIIAVPHGDVVDLQILLLGEKAERLDKSSLDFRLQNLGILNASFENRDGKLHWKRELLSEFQIPIKISTIRHLLRPSQEARIPVNNQWDLIDGNYRSEIDNVAVDCLPGKRTLLNLSHWPGHKTPREFCADLSAESVLLMLDRQPERLDGLSAIVYDHFDIDGLLSVLIISNPELALKHAELLIETARAGDFGCTQSSIARRTAFALYGLLSNHLAHENVGMRSFGDNEADLNRPYANVFAYAWTVIESIDSFSRLWSEEESVFEYTDSLIRRGSVYQMEECEEVAWYFIPEDFWRVDSLLASVPTFGGLSAFAFTNSERAITFALTDGRRLQIHQDYRGWVEGISPFSKRKNMAALGPALYNSGLIEEGWSYSGPHEPHAKFESIIKECSPQSLKKMQAALSCYLRDAPNIWEY